MRRNLQDGGRLRPVDLARGHGLSTQAIRNYEAAGILPGAERTPHGYRTYTPLHAQALRAFLALVPGHGHQTATSIMQAINRDATEDALGLIDESHAQLLDDRRTLQAVEAALRDLEPVPQERGDTFVGPLSRRLGLRPATLLKWERAGLVQPRRNPQTGYRVYYAADIRDALLGSPGQTRWLPAGADRPPDRPGPVRRKPRAARVHAAGLACPPLGQEPRHAHRRRRTGRLPQLPSSSVRRQAEYLRHRLVNHGLDSAAQQLPLIVAQQVPPDGLPCPSNVPF